MVDHFDSLWVDVGIILKLILKKQVGREWTGLTLPMIGAIGGLL
jgi:hypothetical protein